MLSLAPFTGEGIEAWNKRISHKAKSIIFLALLDLGARGGLGKDLCPDQWTFAYINPVTGLCFTNERAQVSLPPMGRLFSLVPRIYS